jgi:hypothetical protein
MFTGMLTAGALACLCSIPNANAALLTNGGNFPYGGEVCAEAAGLTFAPGTIVQLHGCHGFTNQQWSIELGSLFSYGFSDGQTTCMDVAAGATTPGSQVVLNPCSDAPSQIWNLGVGAVRGQIVNTQSNLCLEGRKSGAQLVINTCASSGLSQQWEVK